MAQYSAITVGQNRLYNGSSGVTTQNGQKAINNAFGSGSQGIHLTTRIVMSMKSGIKSEIDWAIMAISNQSCQNPESIKFEEHNYLVAELIKYSFIPFELINKGKLSDLDDDMISLSLNSLLSIRNLIQDLENQQYLSEVENIKGQLILTLKFLNDWFFQSDGKKFPLIQYENEINETFIYIIDILEILTCYYVDNNKHDQLFDILMKFALKVQDRHLIIGIINCLTHLLYIKDTSEDKDRSNLEESSEKFENMTVKTSNNCINAITDELLVTYSNYLLINDNELTETVLTFLKEYLFSRSYHSSCTTIKESQYLRLRKLISIDSIRDTLFKQLPILIVDGLPLINPSKFPIEHQLLKRSLHSSVPIVPPMLTDSLFDVISKFSEPLRASTWLRCCYEPYFNKDLGDPNIDVSKNLVNDGKITPGEVTQLSLWKAYEKQFSKTANKDSKVQPLMPAVDFIKNVTVAFPQANAMVVMLNEETQKKKFIIRGIQPRQFVVGIDVGNYDAIIKRPNPNEVIHDDVDIGTVDKEKFDDSLNKLSQNLTTTNYFINNLTSINLLAKDLLDYIMNEVNKMDDFQKLILIFRLYNKKWLPDLVYTNPNLLEYEIIDNNWIKYLI